MMVKYSYGAQIKEGKTSRICNTHEADEKGLQNSS